MLKIRKIEYNNISYFNYNQFEKAVMEKIRNGRKSKIKNT